VWLLAGFALVALARARVRAPAWAGAAAVAATALVAVVVAVAENPPRTEPYQPMQAIFDSLERSVPRTGATRVEVSNSPETFALGSELGVGVVYWLRRNGRGVVTTRPVADRLNPDYADGPWERVVRVHVDVPTDGGEVIARVPARDPLDQVTTRKVTVTLTPTPRRSARGSRAGSPPRRIAWTTPGSRAGTTRRR
jgi:hypothetical protein